MKNKAGKISGFIIGAMGFLLMFKIIFLKNIPPSDELAPGMVLIIALITGLLFGFIGSSIQNYLAKKSA